VDNETQTGDRQMTRTFDQVSAELEVSKMRMDQARDKLCDAVIAGNETAIARLEKVHAAAIADYKELRGFLAALA
jgi:histidinol dehydrogenase